MVHTNKKGLDIHQTSPGLSCRRQGNGAVIFGRKLPNITKNYFTIKRQFAPQTGDVNRKTYQWEPGFYLDIVQNLYCFFVTVVYKRKCSSWKGESQVRSGKFKGYIYDTCTCMSLPVPSLGQSMRTVTLILWEPDLSAPCTVHHFLD